MMSFQLTLTSLLERAGRLFPRTTIVSQRPDNSTHRYTYADFYARARALASALQHLGLRRGDRVATLMWNHHRHLETYFAVPAVGGVVHTLNLRLHPDELTYIVNHAEDRFLIVDDILLPLFEKIRGRVNLERVIVTPYSGALVPAEYDDYEALLSRSDGTAAISRPHRIRRRGHVLHVGHHRSAQGCRLLTPRRSHCTRCRSRCPIIFRLGAATPSSRRCRCSMRPRGGCRSPGS